MIFYWIFQIRLTIINNFTKMFTIGELAGKAFNFVSLLALMLVVWPWSMIKYFLPKNKKDITGEVCLFCLFKTQHCMSYFIEYWIYKLSE